MPRATLHPGLTLSYEERGHASEAAVVLLPGPTDSWRSYLPVLDLLPQELHVLAVSPRGHGESDKPADGYRVEDLAGDLVAFLDVLDVRRAVLVGHSGSCLVARRVALDHPDRVLGLVLEASPTTLRDERLHGPLESLLSALEDPISADFARTFVTDTSSASLPPELVDLLVEDVLQVPPPVWRLLFSALLEYDDLSELPLIQIPTLLVWGEADALVPREMQDQLVRRIPHAELVVHPGSGHTPRWDDPARFAAELGAFAARFTTGGAIERGELGSSYRDASDHTESASRGPEPRASRAGPRRAPALGISRGSSR
jgi:non-heme chloroperoxidase